MSLEPGPAKIPQGVSLITNTQYFPHSFNCMQEVFTISKGQNKALGKFNRPKKVGHFSIDGERKFKDDDSELKFFAPPVNKFNQKVRRPNFNLNNGMHDPNNVKKNEKHFEGLDNLLRWASLHWDKVSGPGTPQPHVVTWRGVLTKIMNAPFDNKTQWNILAIKHKGTIYLCEYKTDEQHDDLESLPHWVKKTFYWGRKVETFLTANEPGGPPRPEEPVNENSEYVSVFRSQLGQIQLMYGAEVDCVDHTLDPEKYPSPSNFIEIKTQRELKDKQRKEVFRKYKLSKWWAQSFLAGIPRVMTAFRDDRGFVTNLDIIETQSMPRQAALEAYSWKPSTMLGFLERFLTFVRDVMAKVDDCTYVFEWNPEWEGVCFTFDPDQQKETFFLPAWYRDHINTAAQKAAEAKIQEEREKVEISAKVAATKEGEPIVLD